MIKKAIVFLSILITAFFIFESNLVSAEIIDSRTILELKRNKAQEEKSPTFSSDKMELLIDFNPQKLKGELQIKNDAIRTGIGENRNQEIWSVDKEEGENLIKNLKPLLEVDNVFNTKLLNRELFGLSDYFNDPYLDLQWGMEMVELEGAVDYINSREVDSSEGTILIVDSGIWGEHEDFGGMVTKKIECDSTECKSGDDQYFGEHGTHVAGIAGAAVNNQRGIISPNIKNKFNLVSIRVFDSLGKSTGIVNALDYILNNYADQPRVIVNISLGTCYDDPDITEAEKEEVINFLQDKYNQMWSAGLISIAAAGNTGDKVDETACYSVNSKAYPAALENVISVGSLGPEEEKSGFSQYGDWIDVTAPGGDQGQCEELLTESEVEEWVNDCDYGKVDSNRCSQLAKKVEDYQACFIQRGILSLIPPIPANDYSKNDYMSYNGTSQAAPSVSGMAGLIWSVNPDLSNYEIRDLIFSTAEKIPRTGEYWKYGKVNFDQAIQKALGGNDTPGLTPTSTSQPTPASGASPTPKSSSQPSATPIPTSTPTLGSSQERCRQFCDRPTFVQGDADCNGKLDNQDYQVWLKQFERNVYDKSKITELADFDCNGQVNLSDFELWRRNGAR